MAEHHSHGQPREGGKFSKAAFKPGDDGRLPLDVKLPSSVPPTVEIGVGGTQVFGGFINEDEIDAKLRGVAKYKTYSDCLANVAIIAAGVRLLLHLVANAEWKAEPADDSDEAAELAEKAEHILKNMKTPWHRIVRRLAMFRFYGFAVMEWVAKRDDDGTIVFKDCKNRAQITIGRWLLDPHSEVLGVVQVDPQTGRDIPIPRAKLIYVVDDAINDSPEGSGLFRHMVDSCKRLRRLQQLEGFGYEGDLRGIPIGRAPLAELDNMVKKKQITAAKAQSLLDGLEGFINNHIKNPALGIMLDSTPYKGTGEQRTPTATPQWNLELLDGGTYSLAEVAQAISRIQREIARILGVEFMMLGDSNGSGSRSLGETKTQSFGLIVDGTLKEIREQVEADLLGPIWELNGWDEALKPTLKTETQVFKDPAQLAAVLRDLSTAGVMIDRQDELVGELVDLMGLTRLAQLADIDTDLLLSSEDAQRQAVEIMSGKAEATKDKDNDDGSPPSAPGGSEDVMPEDE